MNNYDLSVLIPARNEMFLGKTVESVLKAIRGKTEIIVILDGQWSNPPIVDDERVTIIYNNTSVGQRAATNQAARISNAKYVMKLDAHCDLDEGFDVKLMEAMKGHDNWTVVPLMRNLHAFDWVCTKCSDRVYQGPIEKYGVCDKCGNKREMQVVWKAKESPRSTSFCFDPEPHFQYFAEYRNRPEGKGDITDTMSIQGSCFMLTRDKYWELDICNEEFGSWGSQGIEVAVKTWLSGGEVKCVQTTWYAHMFRTQGGSFGFPYKLSGNQVKRAKEIARDLFFENKWDKQIYPLSWLVEKFWPVYKWTEDDLRRIQDKASSFTNLRAKKIGIPGIVSPVPLSMTDHTHKSKSIIFYTDNQLNLKIAKSVQTQLKKASLPIVSASLKPMNFGKNIHLKEKRGYLTMAKQILAALEASSADIIFFCEHDVLYHPSHFDFTPSKKDVYYYNTNVWRVRKEDGHALWTDDLQQLSGLVGYRETLLIHFRERLKKLEAAYEELHMKGYMDQFSKYIREMGFEPGTHGRPERIDDLKAENFQSAFPNIDIRHDNNLTPSRWNKDQFRNERFTKGWKEANVIELVGWDTKDLSLFL